MRRVTGQIAAARAAWRYFNAMRLAVVGHVEWVEFARTPRVPAAGEIAHAQPELAVAAGGGAVVAVELARLAGAATLFTAFGEDALGEAARAELERRGVTVRAALRSQPTRRALTLVDDAGERTIVTLGERLAPSGADPLPWDELAGADAVYFTAGMVIPAGFGFAACVSNAMW